MMLQVHLEGRSRLLVFETDSDETLVLAPGARRPLAEHNSNNPCTGPLTISERSVTPSRRKCMRWNGQWKRWTASVENATAMTPCSD